MKRFAALAALVVALAGCGTEEAQSPGTTAAPGSTSTTLTSTLPGAEQRELLEEARAAWDANRPARYRFTYSLACECDQGPWTVLVEGPLVGGASLTQSTRALWSAELVAA
jgi:hypothetical protein